ncbi:MAG: hypothetical protein JRF17_09460 [Deltaproteobacteria bacterium]|jgi:hypothetical protein|nr:hypothetical protein [Deltaproteobacteria bacterium]
MATFFACFSKAKLADDSTQCGIADGTYYDQMFLSSLEREHVRKLVLLDLQQQGHLEQSEPSPTQRRRSAAQHRTPEGENLDQYYSSTDEDDIGF